MPIHGSLDEASLPDVLQLLSLGKKTGCLVLTQGSLEGRIFLDEGRVRHAAVTSREGRLGDILVKRGRITREQLSAAVEQQTRAPRKSVGHVLIESGHIERTELEKFVRGQVEEAVYFLFTWRAGHFEFTSNVRPEEQVFLVSVDPESLLLEGARRVDEWSEIAKKIPSLDLIFRLEKDPRHTENIALSEEQQRIIPLIDGARDVKGIVEATGMVEFDVGKALFGLVTAGFAKLVDRRVRVRHLEYRELLAYLVHEAEFADPAKRKEAGRHILDCPACAASLKKIHVTRTEEFSTADLPRMSPVETVDTSLDIALEPEIDEDDAEAPTVEAPALGLQDRVVMQSASDMLMPADAADDEDFVERRAGQRRSGGDRRLEERRGGGERRRAASQDWPAERERRSGSDRRRGGQRRSVEQRRGSDRRAAYARTDRATPGGAAAVAGASLAAVPRRSSGRRTDPRRRTTGPRHAPRRKEAGPAPAAAAPEPEVQTQPTPPAVSTPEVATSIDPDKTIETPAATATSQPGEKVEAPSIKPDGAGQRTPGNARRSEIEWLVTPDESVEMIRSSRAILSPTPSASPPAPSAKPGKEAANTPGPARQPQVARKPPPPPKAPKPVAKPSVAEPPVAAPVPPRERRPKPAAPAPAGTPAPPQAAPAQARAGRWVALVASLAIVAGLAWGLSTVIGSSGQEPVGLSEVDTPPPAAPPTPRTEQDPSAGQMESATLGAAAAPGDDTAEQPPAPAPAAARTESPVSQPTTPQPPRTAPQPVVSQGLNGSVVDALTNRPLAGVRVEITGTGATVTSGQDGTFQFSDPPVGDVGVVARLAGYLDRRASTRVDPRQGGRVLLALQPIPPPAEPAPQPVAVTPPAAQPPVAQPQPEPTPEPVAARPPPAAMAAETDPELVGGDWVRISATQAAEVLGREIVAVPGLPIESVARPSTGSSRTGIRIAQTLDSGDRLELVITRPPFLGRARGQSGEERVSAVRVADRPSPDGTVTGTARLGSHLITARAAVEPGRLRDLMNRLAVPNP